MNAKRAFGLIFVALLIALLGATAARADTWGDPFPIGPADGYKGEVIGAMDAAGNMVVGWTQDLPDPVGNNYSDLFAQRLNPAGAPVGQPFQLNAAGDEQESLGDLSMDAAGNFVAVWWNDYADTLSGRCFAADGAPRGGDFLLGAQGRPQPTPTVEMANDGRFVVAWGERADDQSDNQIYARLFGADCQPLGAPFLVNNVNSGDEYEPAVAMDAAGNFVIAWTGNDGIAARRFSRDGAPRGGQFRVNQRQRNGVWGVDVALDAAGNAMFAWTAYVRIPGWGHNDVYVRRFNARGAALGGESLAHEASAGDEEYPSIAAHASGEFAVVYLSDGPWARFYNAQGRPNGPARPLAAFGSNVVVPALATRGANPYLTLWATGVAYDKQILGRLLDGQSGPPAATFLPTNDAYVSSAAPNAVFNSRRLNVRDAAQDFGAYLKFNVSGLSGDVQAARLRLWVVDAGPDGGYVWATSPYYLETTTLWQETGLTWNNAPYAICCEYPVAPQLANRWVEVDVTPAVLDALADSGRVSLTIWGGSANTVGYSSKEGLHPPQLVVFTE